MSSPVVRTSRAPRALLSFFSLVALFALALLGLGALLPLALDRERQATLEDPSALSLTYLRLSMKERPHDTSLRLELAQAAVRAYALDEARAALTPLLGASGKAGRRARDLMVDIEQRAYAAVPLERDQERAEALERYRAALREVRASELTAQELDDLAQRTREAGMAALRANLLGERARRTPSPSQIRAAEQAFLEAGAPLSAARLRADEALRTGELAPALAALRHARSAAQPDQAFALFERLRAGLGDKPTLLEVGITLASDLRDTRGALRLAERLLELEPSRPERHAQVAQLATWAGFAKRALVEQLWLLEHGAGRELWSSAEATARALSDLKALRAIYAKYPDRPLGRPGLLKRLAVYAALGEPDHAHALLSRALEGDHAGDAALWNLRFAIERSDGRLTEAIDTLRTMQERFPEEPRRSEQLADLLMKVGRLSEAIGVLAAETPRDDYAKVTRLAQIAWSISDVAVARAAYRDATSLGAAKESDYFRLYALDVLEGDLPRALETAKRGLARFDTLPMLELAMSAALTADDPAVLSELFLRSERDGHPFQRDVDHVVLRVSYRQALAQKARAKGDFESAELILAAASHDLTRVLAGPAKRVPLRLRQLASAQHAEELAVALAQDDQGKLEELYARVESQLSPRQKVYILHKLGRDEQAIVVARRALATRSLSKEDRGQLERDARTLAANLPRRVDGSLELTDMGPLRLWQARASATYASSRRILSGGVDYAKLDITDARFVSPARTHQLTPWVGIRKVWHEHDASLKIGVDLRDGQSARPFAVLTEALRIPDASSTLGLFARFNEVPNDTAGLRIFGVRDQLGARFETSFTERWFGTVSADGVHYATRGRERLGGGLNAEGALGMNVFAPESALFGNLRVATRLAPRWSISRALEGEAEQRAHAAGWLVPDRTYWLGLGASLGRGNLAVPPLSGRAFGFLLDGSLGWLFPQDELGYYVRAGVGYSPLGGDLLSISGRASNVLGTQPGSAVWSVQLEYTLGLWR